MGPVLGCTAGDASGSTALPLSGVVGGLLAEVPLKGRPLVGQRLQHVSLSMDQRDGWYDGLSVKPPSTWH